MEFSHRRQDWVKTGVTIKGLEHIEYLPVMDYRNKSIPLDSVTSFDVNKAIQRSLTKACARHGLGLYIYAGEDLPEEDTKGKKNTEKDPDLELALQLVKEANNITDLKQVWREHTAFQNNKQFYAAVQAKNRELSATLGL